MFITLKKRTILIAGLVVIIIFSGVATVLLKTEFVSGIPPAKYTVVIDAGHGGRDAGISGRFTGVKESELNLIYAFNLGNQLKEMGIDVIYTRKDANQLGNPNASNKKRSDMQAREKIINNSGANLVLSLHMNSFSLESCSGAQAFYRKGSVDGKTLAERIQRQLVSLLQSSKKTTLAGDYYIINCTTLPAVIVECGYLTNKYEEEKLQTKEYQNQVCYAIMCGIIDFLNDK